MFLFCCGCRKTVLRLAPNSFISIPKSSFHNIHTLSQAKSIRAEQQEKKSSFPVDKFRTEMLLTYTSKLIFWCSSLHKLGTRDIPTKVSLGLCVSNYRPFLLELCTVTMALHDITACQSPPHHCNIFLVIQCIYLLFILN